MAHLLVNQKKGARKPTERGSALVEFLLSSIVWAPLLLGTIVFGINLVRAIQVSHLSRDTGHMYAYGIDFTQPQNAALLTRLASSLKIQQTSGAGAILLSKITLVTQSDCDAADVNPCTNKDRYVFTSLLVFGDLQYAKSQLGNPSAFYANGTSIKAADYLSKASLVANNFPDIFYHNQPGQYAYVSEVTLNSQSINWSDFSNTGSYARSIF